MRYFALALALFLSASLFAQNKKTKKADELFSTLNFQEATMAYKKALKKDNENTYLFRRIADCYANTGNFEDASIWYAKTLDKGGYNKEDVYHYGQTLIALGKFERGLHWMNQYLENHPKDVRTSLNGGYFDVNALATAPENIVIKPMNANGNLSMLAPTLVEEDLVIAIHEQLPDDWEPSMRYVSGGDLFQVKSNKKFDIRMATPLSGNVVSDQHELAACFDPGEEILYVTRVKEKGNRILKDAKGHPLLEVACYTKKGNSYTFSHLFKYNSSTYSVGFIAIDSKENKLYFSSNSNDGKGGFDIHVCQKNNDGWMTPNLLETCNTTGDEVYLNCSNERLYFASNGWPGLGGLDQFSYGSDGVLNLGAPYNSSSDDYGIMFNNSSTGYFSSGRTDGKGDDLILFEKLERQYLVDFNLKNGQHIPFVQLNNKSTGTSSKKYIDNSSFSSLLNEGAEYSIEIPGIEEELSCSVVEGTPVLSTNAEVQWDAKLQEYYKARIIEYEHIGEAQTHKNIASSVLYPQEHQEGENQYLRLDFGATETGIAKANLLVKDLETGEIVPITTSNEGIAEVEVAKGHEHTVISENGAICYINTMKNQGMSLYSYTDVPVGIPTSSPYEESLVSLQFDEVEQALVENQDESELVLTHFQNMIKEEQEASLGSAPRSQTQTMSSGTVI
ncbi:MAG: tetratricopeptide repeat protein, partial [Flavobacteriales bacterium]